MGDPTGAGVGELPRGDAARRGTASKRVFLMYSVFTGAWRFASGEAPRERPLMLSESLQSL